MFNLIVSDGKDLRKEFPIEEKGITIVGRDPNCHIFLDSKTVSRKHFRIIMKGLKIYIEDLNSSNGVLVNDEKVEKITEISENDILQFGTFYAQLNNTNKLRKSYKIDKIVSEKKEKLRKLNEKPYYKLVSVDKRYPGLVFELSDGTTTVGRTKASNIIVPDDTLSKRHLQFEKIGKKLTAQDLKSANGTLLNGRRLRSKTDIVNGDQIEIGDVRFKIDSNVEIERKKESSKTPLIVVAVLIVVAGLGLFIAKSGGESKKKKKKIVNIDDAIEKRRVKIDKILGRAQLNATKSKWSEAVEDCEKVLSMDPANDKAKKLKIKYINENKVYKVFKEGREALDLLDYEKALKILLKVPKKSYYTQQANMLIRQSRTELVKKYYKDARSFNKARRFKDAYEQLRKLFELTSHHGGAYKLKEEVEYNMKRYRIKYKKFEIKIKEVEDTSTKIDWKKVAKKYPEHELKTAVKYYIKGDIERALKFLAKVGAAHKNYQKSRLLMKKLQVFKSRYAVGNADYIEKNYPKARQSWKLALAVEKEILSGTGIESKYSKSIKQSLSQGFNDLGRSALKNKRYKSAFRYFKEAKEFDPQNTQNLESLSEMHKMAKNFWSKSIPLEKRGDKKAFEYWEAIINITDENDDLHKKARKKILKYGN